MKRTLPLLSALLFVGQAWALDPLGDKTGLSGFVNLGVGGGQIESNFFAVRPVNAVCDSPRFWPPGNSATGLLDEAR
ncbi:MAG: hypothetical protein O7F73_19765 [Gammaproteobacteria bacterium]|nr:hypothetical protein [Gammaproteobacteria bacterium]